PLSMISLVAVSMATVVLESLLYGLFLILFSTNLYLRITRYARPQEFASRGGLWWNPIVISNVAIFATCTAHWIITVDRLFLAFLGSGDPLQFFLDESQPTSVASNTLVVLAVLIGDAVIIHRLWLALNRDLRVVVVPVLSWLGTLMCSIAAPYLFTQSGRTTNRFLTAGGAWLAANSALTPLSSDLTQPVCVILIESAAIWTTSTIFFAATFLTGSTLQFIVRDLTPAIIGLVNLLIHLRVGLGWSGVEAPDATGVPMTSSASIFALGLPTENSECCL
ncbi:hypothetical protein C8R44DRAFT_932619, partial [Mycena epipterygia]